MIAQLRVLDDILAKHGIPRKFHCEFRALVECGVRPSHELRTRLRSAPYKTALDECMAELSATIDDKFPTLSPQRTR